MKKIFMMVYNDISTDARVMRAAQALCSRYEVYLYAVGRPEGLDVKSIPVKNCSSIGGKLNNLRFILGAVTNCLKIKPDIVYGHDIFSAIPLVILRLLNKKSKYVYDAHELFIKHKEVKYPLLDRIQFFFEARAVKTSDMVICALRQRGEIMMKYHKLDKPPVEIKNISYLPDAEYKAFTDKFESFFKTESFKIIYAGGILPGRRLDKLIKAVNELGKGYSLMIVGNGPDYERIKHLAEETGNNNIIVTGSVPYRKLSAVLKNFNAGYLYYPTDNDNNLYCAPNKIYEYAGVDLPIISNENPTVMSMFNEYKIGVCNDNITEAIKYVEQFRNDLLCNMEAFRNNNTLKGEEEKLAEAMELCESL
ncbi:MAG: glycosyltransferase [Clostridia bacterium]|nr:glycosyltransferase [Clostridia bacterium]